MWYTKNHVWTTHELEETKELRSRWATDWKILFNLRKVTASTFWRFFAWMKSKWEKPRK